MKQVIRILIMAVIAASSISCTNRGAENDNKAITVTIPPLEGLVKEIVGDDYAINTILPKGATPENYSPTIAQMATIEESEYLFYMGTLAFENQVINKYKGGHNIDIQKVAEDIELIEGSCKHGHGHDHEGHHHSLDPHVWMSIEGLEKIVDNIAETIINNNPDSVKYVANYEAIKRKLSVNKARYKEMLGDAPRQFLIYHPSLGYLAKEFDLEQIAFENDGKTPSPAGVIDIVEKAKADGLKYILYQAEYPLDVVKPIAEVLNVKPILINPLSNNIIAELDSIINILAGSYEQ